MADPLIALENGGFVPNEEDEPAVDDVVEAATPITRTRRKRSDAGQARGPRDGTAPRRGPKSNDTKLATDLAAPWLLMAQAVGASGFRTTSAVMTANTADITEGAVKLSATRPKLRKALEASTNIGPAAKLLGTAAGILIATQIDLGRMDLDSPLSVTLGVRDIHVQAYGEPTPETMPDNVVGMPDLKPPPRRAGPMSKDPRHPMFAFQAGNGAASVNVG